MSIKRSLSVKLIFLSLNIFVSSFCNVNFDLKQKELSVVQLFVSCKNFDWKRPFQDGEEYEIGGTAFFINDEGYLLSNSHVVEKADLSKEKAISVQLPSLGKYRFSVDVIGLFPDRDIAVLKIKDKDLNDLHKQLKINLNIDVIPFLSFGDSELLNRQDSIVVLGFPLSQENLKCSMGNISGYENLKGKNVVQTTAAMNPGNSGGPVLNVNGEVVGIAYSGVIDAQNVGYFIPINWVRNIIIGFLEGKYNKKLLKPPFWGLSYQFTTTKLLKLLNLYDDEGIRVIGVEKESLFERNGVRKGDIIVAVNDIAIDRFGYLYTTWSNVKVSFIEFLNHLDLEENIRVDLFRKNKKGNLEKLKISIQIDINNQPAIVSNYPSYEDIDFVVVGGMIIMELNENHFKSLQRDMVDFVKVNDYIPMIPMMKYVWKNKVKKQLIITHIFGGTEIYDSRCFFERDIIKKINGKKVNTLKKLRKILESDKNKDTLIIETDDNSIAVISNTYNIDYLNYSFNNIKINKN